MCTVSRHRVFVAGLLFISCVVQATAQEKPVTQEPNRPESGKTESRIQSGFRLQESDDLALPLQPLVPRSAAIDTRNEALAWYMTGRFFDEHHRNEVRKALTAFLKAVKLDPEAIEIYRQLVPLEFELGTLKTAVRYAAKAVELDPSDYGILQMLARVAADAGQLPEAIKHLEQAIKSPRIPKSSPEFVVFNMSLGQLYDKTGQRELAADCYEVIFDAVKNPEKFGMDSRGKSRLLADPATNYEQIGQVLMGGNRLKLALEAFELAGKSSRLGAGNLIYNRAKILFLTEKYEEALTELQKYFDSQRTSKRRLPYQLLADILAKLNRSDELIGRLETMAENDAQNDSLQFFLADRLTDVNELERARAIYDTMLRNGGDASGYAGLAHVLQKMQKSDELLEVLGRAFARGEEAIATLEPEVKALSENKPMVASLIEAGRTRAKAGQLKYEEAYLLAKLASALKETDAASEFYRLAVQLNKNPARPGVLIQMELAKMLLDQRKYKLAVDAYKEVLATRQLNEVGQSLNYYWMAQALAYDNRTEEALEAISKAINIDDDKDEFRFIEAWIYSHAKRWDDAILKFEQLMKDFSDKKAMVLLSQFSLSNIYVQKGELRKGEEILEKVLEVNPENSQVNNDLGYLWADQGKNLEQAEKMIRKALVAEPENGAYLDSLGWVLFKLGKLEEAIPALEQATQKSIGGDATVWDHLGDTLVKAAKVDKAIEAWQTALEHAEEEPASDAQLIERIKDKLKQHGAKTLPRPAEKGAP